MFVIYKNNIIDTNLVMTVTIENTPTNRLSFYMVTGDFIYWNYPTLEAEYVHDYIINVMSDVKIPSNGF